MTGLAATLVIGLAAVTLLSGQSAADDPLANLTSEDLTAGKLLFERHCAACHAPDGTGGRGANLAKPRLRHAADNKSLVTVIQKGVTGSEMPPTWQMTDDEVRRVAGYVRTLGRTAIEKLPGDAVRGRTLYTSSRCSECHIVRGEGSGMGPELSDVGARRSAVYLRQALIEPGKSAPDGFLLISAKTPDGRTIQGIRLNEDPFTIQLRDSKNRIQSLRKTELTEFKKLFGQSLMPAYAGLPAQDLDDLIAYLASLRGEP